MRKLSARRVARKYLKKASFPDSFTVLTPAYLIGYRDSFGSGLGTTKNYTSYAWEAKNDRFNNVDTLLKGVYRIEPESVSRNYAEYRGPRGDERGFSMEELNRLKTIGII